MGKNHRPLIFSEISKLQRLRANNSDKMSKIAKNRESV